jgi:hypothetical protein
LISFRVDAGWCVLSVRFPQLCRRSSCVQAVSRRGATAIGSWSYLGMVNGSSISSNRSSSSASSSESSITIPVVPLDPLTSTPNRPTTHYASNSPVVENASSSSTSPPSPIPGTSLARVCLVPVCQSSSTRSLRGLRARLAPTVLPSLQTSDRFGPPAFL